MTLQKPEIGSPCNQCGICCQAVTCKTGAILMGLIQNPEEATPSGQCQALTAKANGIYSCGLYERPRDYLKLKGSLPEFREAFALFMSFGQGCDSAGGQDTIETDRILDFMIKERERQLKSKSYFLKAMDVLFNKTEPL